MAAVVLTRLADWDVDGDSMGRQRMRVSFPRVDAATGADGREWQPRQSNANPVLLHGRGEWGQGRGLEIVDLVAPDGGPGPELSAEVQEQLAQFRQLDLVQVGQRRLPFGRSLKLAALDFVHQTGDDRLVSFG